MNGTDLAYPWAGPLTYVRESVTRGSAAGAHHGAVHIMAGRDARGLDHARCGLTFPGGTVLSRTPSATITGVRVPLAVCTKCAALR